jgi:hypothetical protein
MKLKTAWIRRKKMKYKMKLITECYNNIQFTVYNFDEEDRICLEIKKDSSGFSGMFILSIDESSKLIEMIKEAQDQI